MSTYALILEVRKLLANLDACLQKGIDHATARGYAPDLLLETRLAPDMFPLVRQIRATCDIAKVTASRLTGREAPSHPNTETTTAELRARIASVLAYLDGFGAADFDGIEARTVSLPPWEGKSMTAADYLVEHALPNFFFHYTTAYALLRHAGVDVGKRDYLGALTFR